MATATIHICDVCGKEDKMKMEFTLKVCRNNGEVAREMDLCLSCCENLDKVIAVGKPAASAAAKVTAEKKRPRNINLVKDVFRPVVGQAKDKVEELRGRQRRRLHAFFLESWLTELLMDALEGSDLRPQISHKGPEISFSDGSELKLKGSSSFELDWIIKEGAVKHNVPVLFLCNGSDKGKIGQLKARSEVTLLAYEYLNDGKDDWICGLMDVA